MKRFISVALAVVMMLSCSITAFAIDWTGLTAEEIQIEIDRAKAELVTREIKHAEGNTVILDADGITVTITSIELYTDYNDAPALKINFTATNSADRTLSFTCDAMYINGWKKMSYFSGRLDAGKKVKGEGTSHDLDEIDISSYEDLESLEIHMKAFDPNTHKDLARDIVTTIYFK